MKWRNSNRKQPYDPNVDGSRNEMRSFVCGQCHVESCCSTKMPPVADGRYAGCFQ